MRVTSRAFWLEKRGNTPDEYEDAYWPEKPCEAETMVARFAVADGATVGWCTGLWARGLVFAYCQRGLLSGKDWASSLAVLRRWWHKQSDRDNLPYPADERMQEGGFSSLVGLTLLASQSVGKASGQWKAMALGDSCLFHVRHRTLLAAFPLERADQFNSYPFLLPTNPDRDEEVRRRIKRKVGKWHPGDSFYLMTDALACWLLRRQEEDRPGLISLAGIQTQQDFAEFVRHERDELDSTGYPRLRNDDTTFFRIEVS